MVKVSSKKIKTTNSTSYYSNLKYKILKYGTLIIMFVLFFDKLTLLILFSLYYAYVKYFTHDKEHFTKLNFTTFDSSYNIPGYNILYSHIFKNTGLNLKSYNNVAIDPSKPLLENNKFLPECCLYNSEYSTSKGCACITPTQQEYLRRRGTNKSSSSFIQNANDYTNLYFSPTLAIQGDPIPFNKNNTNYIIDYKPLTSQKINEFNSMTNLLDNKIVNYSPNSEVTI
jgi:hypothetical protein